MRHRAHTLLYFSEGRTAKDIATLQDLHLDTVYDWRQPWLQGGFASLADKPRSGAIPTQPGVPVRMPQALTQVLHVSIEFAKLFHQGSPLA
jgi:hypothetical protein